MRPGDLFQVWFSIRASKALWDIDVAFFDGRLRGNVVVAWGDQRQIEEEGYAEKMEKPEVGFLGLCQPIEDDDGDVDDEGDRGGQQQPCKIWLNLDTIFRAPDPRLVMWETVLHDLVVSLSFFLFPVKLYFSICSNLGVLIFFSYPSFIPARLHPHHHGPQKSYRLSLPERSRPRCPV